MSRPIISVEALGKCYRVGHQSARRERYTALRDVLARNAAEIVRKTRDLFSGRQIVQGDVVEDFWALKDVSFDVEPGEVVGIIGRNGAGKSTLLKVLSRITEPTTGRVTLRGRVASLLEVGTGFHPELTGRENIFLNGAILGMTRNEIRRKFDEIVDFAEVETFLDTPVKRYSSGMYVRLAFAVAAHLEPEILIVDEVLAVGDAEFQKKCLGKMGDVAKGGRTVLFVSHNMDAINRLCTRGILFHAGSLSGDGEVKHITQEYLSHHSTRPASSSIDYPEKQNDSYHIVRIDLLGPDGKPAREIFTWDPLRIRITFNSPSELKNGSVVLQISTLSGVRLLLASTTPDQNHPVRFQAGRNAVELIIPKLMLNAGRYQLGAALAIPNVEYLCDGLDFGILEVSGRDIHESGLIPDSERYLVPMGCEWATIDSNTVSNETI